MSLSTSAIARRYPLFLLIINYYNLLLIIYCPLPQECFQPKDYLNLRYHHKRALYLSTIASHLKRSSLFESVKFSHMNAEVLRPILLLKPKGETFIKNIQFAHQLKSTPASDYKLVSKLFIVELVMKLIESGQMKNLYHPAYLC